MIQAFKIGVTIALTNQVSSALGLIARDFVKTQAQADKLQKSLKEIKLLAVTGGVIAGAGFMGLNALSKLVDPAREYAHQLNILNMAGWEQKEVADAVGLAWKNTGDVITTTATGNLRALMDLKNVLGDLGEARMALPIVTKIGTVMASSSEKALNSHPEEIAFAMAKGLDVIGAARNPEQFAKEAGLMSKVITAFQNRVTPAMFQGVFTYARQAKFDMSDEFKYEFLPSIMLEMSAGAGSSGGGSRGVGPMLAALYRFTNQGYVNRKSIPELQKLGLMTGPALNTTTPGTVVAPLKGHELAANNPFLWTQNVLLPAIKKVYGENVGPQKMREVANAVFRGNQLAAAAVTEFLTKPANYFRDQDIIRKAMPYNQAYDQAIKNDPEMAFKAAQTQWRNLQTVVGNELLPVVIPALQKLSTTLHDLTDWAREHETLTRNLVLTVGAVTGLAAVGGSLMVVTAGIRALTVLIPVLGTVMTVFSGPVGWAIAGILATVTAAWAVYDNWDVIKPKLLSIWDGISNWFTRFTEVIGDGMSMLWQRIKELIPDWLKPGNTSLGQALGTNHGGYPRGSILDTKPGIKLGPVTLPGRKNQDADEFLGPDGYMSGVAEGPKVDVQGWMKDVAARKQGIANAQGAGAPAANMDYLATAFARSVADKLNGMSVNMDGREVGKIVTNYQSQEAKRPPADTSMFDWRLAPAYPTGGNF